MEDDSIKNMSYQDARSIHIFAWPFMVPEEADTGTATDFYEELEKKGWGRKPLDFLTADGDMLKMKEAYMLDKYLSVSAQKVFTENGNDICRVYEYDLNPFGENEKYFYRIGKNGWETDSQRCFDLLMESIELHLYKSGVGILFLRTLNMDPDTSVEDIKYINDKGRSISLPFIPEEKNGYIACADALGVVVRSNVEKALPDRMYMTDFRKRVKYYFDAEEAGVPETIAEAKRQLMSHAVFLDYVLNVNLDDKGENTLQVQGVNDYRMYVLSLIRDEALSRKIKDRRWRESEGGEKLWYSVLHIDEGSATCQHPEMRRKLLNGSSYMRWADEGTLYGMTEYSFVCLTDSAKEVDLSVVRAFYVNYTYMVSLTLAQKIGFVCFGKRLEELAENMKKNKFGCFRKSVGKQLVALQENYIVWKNQVLISEFSTQEQGMELYHLMQKQLLVYREKEIVDEKVESLYEIVNIDNGIRNNLWGIVWTVLSFVVSILSLLEIGKKIWP